MVYLIHYHSGKSIGVKSDTDVTRPMAGIATAAYLETVRQTDPAKYNAIKPMVSPGTISYISTCTDQEAEGLFGGTSHLPAIKGNGIFFPDMQRATETI